MGAWIIMLKKNMLHKDQDDEALHAIPANNDEEVEAGNTIMVVLI